MRHKWAVNRILIRVWHQPWFVSICQEVFIKNAPWVSLIATYKYCCSVYMATHMLDLCKCPWMTNLMRSMYIQHWSTKKKNPSVKEWCFRNTLTLPKYFLSTNKCSCMIPNGNQNSKIARSKDTYNKKSHCVRHHVKAKPWLSVCPSHVPAHMNYLSRHWAQWVVRASLTGRVMTMPGLILERRLLIGDLTWVSDVSQSWHCSAVRICVCEELLHRIQINQQLPNCSLYLPVQCRVSFCKWLAR